jgi:hypothetical protein
MSIALDIDPLCDTDSTTYPRVILRASGVYGLGGTTLMFPTQFGGMSGVILAEPQGDRLAVRMGADLKEYWNDPLLLFGPRQPLAAAQH